MIVKLLFLMPIVIYVGLVIFKPHTVINAFTSSLQMSEVDAGKTSAIVLLVALIGGLFIVGTIV